MSYQKMLRRIWVPMPLTTLLFLSALHLCEVRVEASEVKNPCADGKAKEAEMATRGNLTEEEGKYLLLVARKTIHSRAYSVMGMIQIVVFVNKNRMPMV